MKLFLKLVLFILIYSALYAQIDTSAQKDNSDFNNPFTTDQGITASKDTSKGIQPEEKKHTAKAPFWYRFNIGKKYVNDLQRKLNVLITNLVDDYRSNMTFVKGFLIFFVSFLYAILHAAGPGHGKLILGTYFLTNDRKRSARDAFIAGGIVASTHFGGAVLISGLLYVFIHSFGNQREMGEIAKLVGGIFVIITGVGIIATTAFRDKLTFLDEEKNAEKFKDYPLYFIAFISGIVPCPLAWSVLILCITLNVYKIGLLSVFGMAIGAALVVGFTGLIIIKTKDSLFSHFKREKAEKFAYFLRYCGGVFLIAFGYLMTKVIL